MRHTSEHIRVQRVCRQIGVKVLFKSRGALRDTLTKLKTPRVLIFKKGVIYKIPCKDHEKAYIGETGRNLQKRMAEHKGAVRGGDTNNGVSVHAWKDQHRVNWEVVSVLVQEHSRRRVLEAIEIQKHGNTMNLNCGLTLNLVWTPFI